MKFVRRHGRIWAGSFLVIAATVALISCQSVRWKIVKSKTRRAFPGVAQLSTGKLSAWTNDPRRQPPVLLDVRTKAEYKVSHLAHAIRVEPGSDPAALQLSGDQPIVTYCSVGYRSSAFAEKLAEAGFKNVVNLEGSIFQWVNENRPLVNDAGQTDKVHPFNALWGTLLDKSHRAGVTPLAQ